jgi:Ubiquitin-conjugating enzyme
MCCSPIFAQMTIKRIHREISDLKKEEMGEMTLGPTEQSLFNWRGSIPGPSGSCYEGGLFWMEITLPPDYPCVFLATVMCSLRDGVFTCTFVTNAGFPRLKSCLRHGM